MRCPSRRSARSRSSTRRRRSSSPRRSSWASRSWTKPQKAILSLWEWTKNDTERKTRDKFPQHRLPYKEETDRIIKAAFTAAGPDGLLVASPDFKLTKAGKDATGEATKARIKEGKGLVDAFNAEPAADKFIHLADWAFIAVHNPDQEQRDNPGLRAIYDWTREVGHEALRRWIAAGHQAALFAEIGWDPEMSQAHIKPRDRRGVRAVSA